MEYILPILLFVALGLVAGILLSIFSKVFAVKQDQRVYDIKDSLPNANCGACGYSGCEAYANAIVKDGAKTNLCIPGGDKVSRKISEIMGTSFEDVAERKATVRCNGKCGAVKDKYIYTGAMSCAASNMLYNGKKECTAGCLGLGDCIKACKFEAIDIIEGVAVINREKCTGCGMCKEACPNDLIGVFDEDKTVEVICSSHFNAKETIRICENGCIGCRKCEKVCPHDAVHVVNNHAIIDHDKCTSCGECVEVCPRKCIHKL